MFVVLKDMLKSITPVWVSIRLYGLSYKESMQNHARKIVLLQQGFICVEKLGVYPEQQNIHAEGVTLLAKYLVLIGITISNISYRPS